MNTPYLVITHRRFCVSCRRDVDNEETVINDDDMPVHLGCGTVLDIEGAQMAEGSGRCLGDDLVCQVIDGQAGADALRGQVLWCGRLRRRSFAGRGGCCSLSFSGSRLRLGRHQSGQAAWVAALSVLLLRVAVQQSVGLGVQLGDRFFLRDPLADLLPNLLERGSLHLAVLSESHELFPERLGLFQGFGHAFLRSDLSSLACLRCFSHLYNMFLDVLHLREARGFHDSVFLDLLFQCIKACKLLFGLNPLPLFDFGYFLHLILQDVC
mmetsp:Transcript_1008/g.1573  ORF Transcript_1008/g.1573 Transcript_1008/m.1573 type:complete len:267 (-) Transcript_1008:1194-1994(-)